jgi:hypothetical protein
MFSDFAYLDQAIFLIASLLFIVHRFRSSENFQLVNLHALRRVELKAVAIMLLLSSMVIMIIYNLTAGKCDFIIPMKIFFD